MIIVDRIFHTIATHTQANARWSYTNPPLAQTPRDLRYLYKPDKGWPWITFDHDQVELRLVAAECKDPTMLEGLTKGWDLHLMACCVMFKIPMPPVLVDPIHAPENLDWRTTHRWLACNHAEDLCGKDDIRRTFAKRFGHRQCVPLDTQILTRDGWRTYETVSIGQEVLTYNPAIGQKEWQPLLDKVHYSSAPVWEVKNNWGFCVRATDEHRWFVRQRTWRGRYWGKPYMMDEVRVTGEINTESNIITNAKMGPDSGLGAILSQSKYGTDWTREVCRMSNVQREAFLRGFLLADGSQNRKTGVWSFHQQVGPLSDAILTAAFIQHSGNIYVRVEKPRYGDARRQMTGILSQRGHITGQKLQKRELPWQPVWCPVTRNGSWIMRQGNCIAITGNSYGGTAKRAGDIPGAKSLGLTSKDLQQMSQARSALFPQLNQWQNEVFLTGAKAGETRTWYGRRRRYLSRGTTYLRGEMLDHPMQAGVQDIETLIFLSIADYFGDDALYKFGMHDSQTWAFHEPRYEEAKVKVREIAQPRLQISGTWMDFPASFKFRSGTDNASI